LSVVHSLSNCTNLINLEKPKIIKVKEITIGTNEAAYVKIIPVSVFAKFNNTQSPIGSKTLSAVIV